MDAACRANITGPLCWLQPHTPGRFRPPQEALHQRILFISPRSRGPYAHFTRIEDYTSKEIASFLKLSVRTVDNHRQNICRKLNLHGTHSLLKFAFDNSPCL